MCSFGSRDVMGFKYVIITINTSSYTFLWSTFGFWIEQVLMYFRSKPHSVFDHFHSYFYFFYFLLKITSQEFIHKAVIQIIFTIFGNDDIIPGKRIQSQGRENDKNVKIGGVRCLAGFSTSHLIREAQRTIAFYRSGFICILL